MKLVWASRSPLMMALILVLASSNALADGDVAALPSSTDRAKSIAEWSVGTDGAGVDDGARVGGGDSGFSVLFASRMSTSSLAWQDMEPAWDPHAGAMHIRVNSVSGEGGAGGRSGRGKAYMIAGGAAFIGGLIIGDTVGTVIAVGGLGLGVYGAILYF